jgi:hypothetical protein
MLALYNFPVLAILTQLVVISHWARNLPAPPSGRRITGEDSQIGTPTLQATRGRGPRFSQTPDLMDMSPNFGSYQPYGASTPRTPYDSSQYQTQQRLEGGQHRVMGLGDQGQYRLVIGVHYRIGIGLQPGQPSKIRSTSLVLAWKDNLNVETAKDWHYHTIVR